MKSVIISGSTIKLGQFLKLIGTISTGGEAKYFLIENTVKINGLECKTRGKTLFIGDIVEVFNTKYVIVGEKWG